MCIIGAVRGRRRLLCNNETGFQSFGISHCSAWIPNNSEVLPLTGGLKGFATVSKVGEFEETESIVFQQFFNVVVF